MSVFRCTTRCLIHGEVILTLSLTYVHVQVRSCSVPVWHLTTSFGIPNRHSRGPELRSVIVWEAQVVVRRDGAWAPRRLRSQGAPTADRCSTERTKNLGVCNQLPSACQGCSWESLRAGSMASRGRSGEMPSGKWLHVLTTATSVPHFVCPPSTPKGSQWLLRVYCNQQGHVPSDKVFPCH